MVRSAVACSMLAASLLVSAASGPAVACEARGFDTGFDRFVAFRGQNLRIGFDDLLDNDDCRGPCKGTLQFLTVVDTGWTKGDVFIRNGRIVYKPPVGFNGKTSFRYLVTDATGRTFASEIVRVRVRPSVS